MRSKTKTAKEHTSYYMCTDESGERIAAGTAYSIFNDLAERCYFENRGLQKYSHIGFINVVKTVTQDGWSRKVGFNRTNGKGLETYLIFDPITPDEMQKVLNGESLDQIEIQL